ncbi:phage major capsid protein [Sphingobium sp. TB-6]|uniref:phage major capsid protein n=1 Tax=Sphingobium sp. TB-6 TaxID=2728850 RepID=UPI00146AFA97|nr:phage major capsid protein [Sphingobium sp. TB-6]NML88751.1 phage major capsid protein [Sphingobium sp. TB-6]
MTTETKSAAELAAETKALVDKKFDEVKALAERALGMAEKGEEASKSFKEQIDGALTGANEVKQLLTELEQKIATDRRENTGPQSAGSTYVNSAEFKSFAEQPNPRGRITVEVKDITSLSTDAAGSAGALIENDTRPAMVPLPQRRLTVRALIAPGQTTSNTIEYDREKVFTNNAATVAEGAAKPQSELQFEEATSPVRKIAHWFRMSSEILADAPGLRSVIDQRLRYGLAFKEEAQLLNGSGTGTNLTGLVTAATAYSAPASLASANMLDTIRLGILQVVLAEYPANGIVLNPIDWAVMEMLKDAAGGYLIGNPQGAIAPTLWGLPVVPTQAMTEDKFLVGAFDLGAQIFDRMDATVSVSNEDQDNFIKNKVTIMAEERLALAIYRPQSFVYGDLGRV